eukprot:TRINITY_DN7872_c0_g1_i2.p1 TRINITY_DN7872_c0_g1~~TRINITY_DN7872_c0_g1_i2.p1  ORF type:complete len:569 (+),score=134.01 TRINITY_DN7872_c0_g1_i2:172-1707(+)
MVPVGKKAFFKGRLVHTNELTVLVGDSYFLKRTGPQAIGIAERRIEALRGELEKLNHELEGLGLRTSLMPDKPVDNPNSEVREIFEELPEGMDPKDLLKPEHASKQHPTVELDSSESRAVGVEGLAEKEDADEGNDDNDDEPINYGYGFDRAQFDPRFMAQQQQQQADDGDLASSLATGTTDRAADRAQVEQLDKFDKRARLMARLAALEEAEAGEDSDEDDVNDEYDDRSQQQRMIDQLATLHVPPQPKTKTVKVPVHASKHNLNTAATATAASAPANSTSTSTATLTPADVVRLSQSKPASTATSTTTSTTQISQQTTTAPRRASFSAGLEQGPTPPSGVSAPPILKPTGPTPIHPSAVRKPPPPRPPPPSKTNAGGTAKPTAAALPAVSGVMERRPGQVKKGTGQMAAIQGGVVERSGRPPTEQQLEVGMTRRELLAAEAQSWLQMQQRAVAQSHQAANEELASSAARQDVIPTLKTGYLGRQTGQASKQPAKKSKKKSLFMQQMQGN